MVNFNDEETSIKIQRRRGSGVIIFILLILLVGAIGGLIWSYLNYSAAKKQVEMLSTAEGQQQMAEKEIAKIVEKVGNLIVLPENETPIMATIEKADELAASQPFYRGSVNGDVVLIYQQAAKAIIYNVTKNILVNVGPVFMDNSSSTTTDKVKEPEVQKITVEFRNGTEIAGLAKTRSEEINQNLYSVVKISEANGKNYTDNIIINNKNVNTASLETTLGAKSITVMPEGETVGTADVVVIIGK